MWQSHSFLVPLLNGQPYSAKSPLLFWLIHLGWAIFGVNDWWPRLIQPALAIVDGWLTARLARSLWPQSPDIARRVPWLLSSGIFWLAFSTLVMFDLLLGACVLLAALGVWQAVREDRPAAWLRVGLALGLGLLAKGPVMSCICCRSCCCGRSGTGMHLPADPRRLIMAAWRSPCSSAVRWP